MKKIVTLTLNPCIDTTIWVNELIPEKKLKAINSEDEAGGGGINVSRALNYLQYKSTAVYLGGGKNGAQLKRLLDNENIENYCIEIDGNTRNNLLIIDNATTKEYRIGMPSSEISALSTQNFLDKIKLTNADFFVLSGSIPTSISIDFYKALSKVVKERNAKLIVDTSGDALTEILKEEVFLVKPNLNELALLCGINENDSLEVVMEAAQNLLAKIKCSALVVSLGKDGALLITKDITIHQKAPTVEVKSTVGAGDCMVACITLALANNLNWKEVLEYGVAGGSAATLNNGKSLINQIDFGNILNVIQTKNGSL